MNASADKDFKQLQALCQSIVDSLGSSSIRQAIDGFLSRAVVCPSDEYQRVSDQWHALQSKPGAITEQELLAIFEVAK